LNIVLPCACLRRSFGRKADFVIEGGVDPREPLREEGPFGDHTGYYTLPEPYPVFHVTAITHRERGFAGLLRAERCGSLRP